MADTALPTLLAAVRRHLWRARFVAAARAALAASAGLALAAVAVHLALQAVPLGALPAALALPWAVALAWAAAQRPADARCALWADRHLGGASAYTTLIEQRQAALPPADVQARRWLEQWTQARVPDSLRQLGEQPAALQLTRPLLVLAVCGTLAALVLALPSLAPSPRHTTAGPPAAGGADRAQPLAEAPVPADLVNDITRALRARAPQAEAEAGPGQGGAAAADGPAERPDTGAAAALPPADAAPASGGAASRAAPAGAVPAEAPGAGGRPSAGNGAGREAGDSRDDRAEVGVSRALRGAIPVQRSGAGLLRPSAERRADADQRADYDPAPATPGPPATAAGPTAAAATPPTAAYATRLTPTETGYVQAWMRANAQRP
jgi:hypothetical protein